MFNYSKAELSEIANKQNFIRDTLEKVVRLSEVLDYINSNPIMKGCLALKGGTAINLTVFHLPRLSVDIDLDSFVFTYTNLGGMRDNIKVEINYSLRSHLFEPEDKPVLSDVIHMEHLITVLSPVELFAAKINALLSRAAARDLYDTYNMIDIGLFSKDGYEMLRKSVVFYTAISQEEIPERYEVNVIDRISIRKIRTDLLPVIQKGEFIELEKIKNRVKEFLSGLMVLTVDEQVIRRISNHPMALWKMQER